jgi:plasmid stabilization system protein ParE
MSYRVLIQPTAFQEIETSYRWLCDRLSPEIANNWYYELQDAIASLQKFPNRCSIAPESNTIGRKIRQLWIGKRKSIEFCLLLQLMLWQYSMYAIVANLIWVKSLMSEN